MMNSINTKQSMKGEYNAKLYDYKGRLKYESGWKPNLILDQGLYYLTIKWGSGTGYNFIDRMCLGTSDTAVNINQVGLQGTELGIQGTSSGVSGVNLGAPEYARQTVKSWTFAPGNGTGLVKEFVFLNHGLSNSASHATVRVVLDTPITKGASDQLVIEHRLTWYPELEDVTGVIDISGTAYNYLVRPMYVNANPSLGGHVGNFVPYSYDPGSTGNWTGSMRAYTGEPITNIAAGTPTGDLGGWGGKIINSQGGPAGPYYNNHQAIYGVDTWNGNIRTIRYYLVNANMYVQVRLGKVSDDSPLTKENTHELTLNFRNYPVRYIP